MRHLDLHTTYSPPLTLIHTLKQRAIENGANSIAEGFLFSVATALIIGETWRSSRNQSRRRDDVDDQLDALGTKVVDLTTRVDDLAGKWETDLREERERSIFPFSLSSTWLTFLY